MPFIYVLILVCSLFSITANQDYPLGFGSAQELLNEPPSDYTFDIQSVDRIIRELSPEEALQDLLKVKTPETATPNIWPVVGVVSSDYGWRFLAGRREFHTGIDIAAPYGMPVVSSADGRVIYSGWIRGYGKTVIIYHGYGFVTLYAHLSEISVYPPDDIYKGQMIGKIGTTGRSFGPHLHYEVLRYGIRQNPIPYLP
ncbi:MAG: M23 family metallopeptidase [Aquificaceae bacterium]